MWDGMSDNDKLKLIYGKFNRKKWIEKYVMYFYDFGERGFLYGIQDMKSIDFSGMFVYGKMYYEWYFKLLFHYYICIFKWIRYNACFF